MVDETVVVISVTVTVILVLLAFIVCCTWFYLCRGGSHHDDEEMHSKRVNALDNNDRIASQRYGARISVPQRYGAKSSLPQRYGAKSSLPQRYGAKSSLPQRYGAKNSVSSYTEESTTSTRWSVGDQFFNNKESLPLSPIRAIPPLRKPYKSESDLTFRKLSESINDLFISQTPVPNLQYSVPDLLDHDLNLDEDLFEQPSPELKHLNNELLVTENKELNNKVSSLPPFHHQIDDIQTNSQVLVSESQPYHSDNEEIDADNELTDKSTPSVSQANTPSVTEAQLCRILDSTTLKSDAQLQSSLVDVDHSSCMESDSSSSLPKVESGVVMLPDDYERETDDIFETIATKSFEREPTTQEEAFEKQKEKNEQLYLGDEAKPSISISTESPKSPYVNKPLIDPVIHSSSVPQVAKQDDFLLIAQKLTNSGEHRRRKSGRQESPSEVRKELQEMSPGMKVEELRKHFQETIESPGSSPLNLPAQMRKDKLFGDIKTDGASPNTSKTVLSNEVAKMKIMLNERDLDLPDETKNEKNPLNLQLPTDTNSKDSQRQSSTSTDEMLSASKPDLNLSVNKKFRKRSSPGVSPLVVSYSASQLVSQTKPNESDTDSSDGELMSPLPVSSYKPKVPAVNQSQVLQINTAPQSGHNSTEDSESDDDMVQPLQVQLSATHFKGPVPKRKDTPPVTFNFGISEHMKYKMLKQQEMFTGPSQPVTRKSPKAEKQLTVIIEES